MNRILLFVLPFLLFTEFLQAQPDYTVEGKVYTSIKSALLQPDSVTRLKLRRKGLKEIPPEVMQLKNLRELDLTSNKISRIPWKESDPGTSI